MCGGLSSTDPVFVTDDSQVNVWVPNRARSNCETPDPARLERAATLTDCGQDAPLPGRRALGGLNKGESA